MEKTGRLKEGRAGRGVAIATSTTLVVSVALHRCDPSRNNKWEGLYLNFKILKLLNPKLGDFFSEIGYGRSCFGQKRGRFAVSIVNLCRYRIQLIISATRDLPA